jgi:hypothetical protein
MFFTLNTKANAMAAFQSLSPKYKLFAQHRAASGQAIVLPRPRTTMLPSRLSGRSVPSWNE